MGAGCDWRFQRLAICFPCINPCFFNANLVFPRCDIHFADCTSCLGSCMGIRGHGVPWYPTRDSMGSQHYFCVISAQHNAHYYSLERYSLRHRLSLVIGHSYSNGIIKRWLDWKAIELVCSHTLLLVYFSFSPKWRGGKFCNPFLVTLNL